MTDHPSSRQGRDSSDNESDSMIPDLQAEREADRLVHLLGERALRRLDPANKAGRQFFRWWAQELRARTSRAELEARAAAFERRVRERIAAEESRVDVVGHPAVFRSPTFEATVTSMIDRAPAEGCVAVLGQGVAAGAGRDLWDEPCMSWLELPDAVPPGKHVALTVSGDSMEPLLYAGDTILVKLDPELRRGAVIVARRPDDGYVVKRVSRVGPKVVELTSLHPGYAPIRIPRRDGLVLGTVLMCWRQQPRDVPG